MAGGFLTEKFWELRSEAGRYIPCLNDRFKTEEGEPEEVSFEVWQKLHDVLISTGMFLEIDDGEIFEVLGKVSEQCVGVLNFLYEKVLEDVFLRYFGFRLKDFSVEVCSVQEHPEELNILLRFQEGTRDVTKLVVDLLRLKNADIEFRKGDGLAIINFYPDHWRELCGREFSKYDQDFDDREVKI